jgi:hypothetical protein
VVLIISPMHGHDQRHAASDVLSDLSISTVEFELLVSRTARQEFECRQSKSRMPSLQRLGLKEQ